MRRTGGSTTAGIPSRHRRTTRHGRTVGTRPRHRHRHHHRGFPRGHTGDRSGPAACRLEVGHEGHRAQLPFLPLRQRLLPSRLHRLSVALLKATALEIAILAGILLLIRSGITEERRGTPALPPPDAPRLPTGTKPPVVLLHGFIDNRSVFVLLRRNLAQHGRQHIESLNYSPLTNDIRAAAELLGRHIEDICERTGREQVDIVAQPRRR